MYNHAREMYANIFQSYNENTEHAAARSYNHWLLTRRVRLNIKMRFARSRETLTPKLRLRRFAAKRYLVIFREIPRRCRSFLLHFASPRYSSHTFSQTQDHWNEPQPRGMTQVDDLFHEAMRIILRVEHLEREFSSRTPIARRSRKMQGFPRKKKVSAKVTAEGEEVDRRSGKRYPVGTCTRLKRFTRFRRGSAR